MKAYKQQTKGNQTMKQYLSCAETAVMIRQVLKESFPGVKFSVRSSVYSGGASINIKYQDGPNADAVKAAVSIFEASYFDGMQDYKGQNYTAIDGQQIWFGADFVFVDRKISDELYAAAIDALYVKFAGNFASDSLPRVTVEEVKNGASYSREIPGLGNGLYGGFNRYLGQVVEELSADFPVQQSATLARISSLGDDGYGQGCVGRLAA
jgi:hypothetical protein